MRKLTLQDVREIRKLLALGVTQAGIAYAYGVSKMAVSNIKTGRTWKESTDAG
jgi:DNA invertase Pin-like site-specific DNA recombinase